MAWNFHLPAAKGYTIKAFKYRDGDGDPDVLDTDVKPVYDAHHHRNIPEANCYLEHITQEWMSRLAPFVLPYGYGHTAEYHGHQQRRINILNREFRQFFGLLAKLQWYRQNGLIHMMKGWQVTVDDDLENKLEADFNRKFSKPHRHLAIRYDTTVARGYNWRQIHSCGWIDGIKAHMRDHMGQIPTEERRRENGEVWLERTVSEFPDYADPVQKHYYTTPQSPEAHRFWNEQEILTEEKQWFISALWGRVPIGTRSATLSTGQPVTGETIHVTLKDTSGDVDTRRHAKYEWWAHSSANGDNPELIGVGPACFPQQNDIGKFVCCRIYYISAEQYSLAVETPMTGAVAPKE